MGAEFYGSLEVDMCCRCLASPARWFGGHVTHGPHVVTAGWCEPCNEELHGSHCTRLYAIAAVALGERVGRSVRAFLDSTCMGWCGHWVAAMGLRLRGAPSMASVRAGRREARIANLHPSPRDVLAMHFGDATQAPRGGFCEQHGAHGTAGCLSCARSTLAPRKAGDP